MLRPSAINLLVQTFMDVETPLAKYYDTRPNGIPGAFVQYDMIAGDRTIPVNVDRAGPPIYVDPEQITMVSLPAMTVRPGGRIGAQTMNDFRRPGSGEEKRGQSEVVRRAAQMRRQIDRYKEYMRAEGLQGVLDFRPPSAFDLHYDELLLCGTDCIAAAPTAPWNTAAATEAAARANLANIATDFQTAIMAIDQAGFACDTLVTNRITNLYVVGQLLQAGYEFGADVVFNGGIVSRIFGITWDVVDETYIHPVSGAVNFYIPTNVAIFLDSNAQRAGRYLVECEPVHIDAPEGTYGVYASSYEWQEPPGEVRLAAEWTGAPVVQDCAQYIIANVTASR